jgi:ubiquinone/menaquinone biosynthesis C-methylase UbiE
MTAREAVAAPAPSGIAGNYPIESRNGEIERLEIQADAVAPDARVMLDLIGVQAGWRCVDLGCGPRGITDLLSERVGPAGRVVGVDKNEQFLAHGRARAAANVEFRHGDACDTGLSSETFDLVHMRFVAGTTSDPESLLREAIRLARPGAVVALQEPDAETMACYPPHPAWDRLMAAMEGVFASIGADVHIARRLHTLMAQAGLTDIHYRPFLLGLHASDPMIDHLPATIESLRGTILQLGLLSEAEMPVVLAQCRAHLRDPGTVVRSFMVAQVWGRKNL